MASYPVVRISKGHFTSEQCDKIQRLIDESAQSLVPALKQLHGLIYYSAAVDTVTNTVINLSIWTDLTVAKQMDTLPEMLAQRPILEQAGVQFDKIANYEPLWVIQNTEAGVITGSISLSQE